MHRKNKILTTLTVVLAIGAGASLTLGFAPFRFWGVSFLSILSLILLFKKQENIKSAFYLGFAWGVGFFATSVSWVFVSIYKYGNTSIYTAILITTLFIAFLALFPAVNLYLLKKFKIDDPSKWNFVLAFASSWVLLEIFRGWVFTGFPWGLLGYTQLSSPLKYYASWVGVYGVSFVVAVIACLLAAFFYLNNYKKKAIILSLILLCFALPYLLNNLIHISSSSIISLKPNVNYGATVRVAMIQANIKPSDKFLIQNPATIIDSINEIYWLPTIDLVKKHKLDLVIWPENSLPIEVQHPVTVDFLNKLNKLSLENNFGLLLGVPIEHGNKYNYFYNSVLALGVTQGVYHKRNLVPFGDYVPLENLFRGLINFFNLPMSSFVAGLNKQHPIKFADNNIVATICYDIAYADYVRAMVINNKASVIVAVSEDGWFGDSLGPHQHLDIARMRAIETGRYVLRATTSGISAIIDNYGNIVKKIPQFKKFSLIGEYRDCSKYNTLWNKLGNKVIIFGLLFGLITAILINNKRQEV